MPLATIQALTCGAIAGQAAFVLWGILALPTGGKQAIEALQAGLVPTALSLPEVIGSLSQTGQAEYLHRRIDNYDAIDWLNHNSPASAGVVLYEDVHGFYLDRPYLWGNREHSAYIPYDHMNDGADLSHWLWQRGTRFVMINLNRSPDNEPTRRQETGLTAGPVGREIEALGMWYVDKDYRQGDWRRLLADAIAKHIWTPRYWDHGVVVLEISDSNSTLKQAGTTQ